MKVRKVMKRIGVKDLPPVEMIAIEHVLKSMSQLLKEGTWEPERFESELDAYLLFLTEQFPNQIEVIAVTTEEGGTGG